MKSLCVAFAAFLSFAWTATATDFPRFETFLGYNWVRFHPNSDFLPNYNANGGSGQFAYNFSHGVGIAFDAGVVTKDTFGGIFTTRQSHFLVGPRFAYHNHSRFTPFGEVLFGGAHGSLSLNVDDIDRVPVLLPSSVVLPDNVDVRLTASRNSFAMMAGGGFDIRLSKHISYRVIQADYYLVRPASLITGDDVNRNNVRLATGVNFTWGAR